MFEDEVVEFDNVQVKFEYEEFVQLVKIIKGVLSLDKKLTGETRNFIIKIPKQLNIEEKQEVEVYLSTHSIQTKYKIKGHCRADEDFYLDINLKSITDILSTFGKYSLYLPETIQFQYDKDSYKYSILISKNEEGVLAENYMFILPYNFSHSYIIDEIEETLSKAEGNWVDINKQFSENVETSFTDWYLHQLEGLLPLFKMQSGTNIMYLEFSQYKTYIQTLATLTLMKGYPLGCLDLKGMKFAEDPARLLGVLFKQENLYYYKDKERCNFIIKTDEAMTQFDGVYILNYKTSIYDYREVQELVTEENFIKVKKDDLITRLMRLKLTDGKTEVSIEGLNEGQQKQSIILNMENSAILQSLLVYEVKGEEYKDLKVYIVPQIIDNILPSIINSEEEYVYIYLVKTNKQVWTFKFTDSEQMWETYCSLQGYSQTSFSFEKKKYNIRGK